MSEASRSTAARGMPSVLVSFSVTVLGLTALSLVYAFVTVHVLHARWPYNAPYFLPNSDLYVYHWDFKVFQPRFQQFHTPEFWDSSFYPFTYPALCGALFAVFYKLPHPVWVYLGILLAGIAGGCWLLTSALIGRGVSRSMAIAFTLIATLTSWPLVFLFQRANIEGIAVLLTAAGILAVVRRKWWLAAVFISLAGAMKIFPLILLGLLLPKRRYREFAFGFVVVALATLASLAWLGPNPLEAQRHISEGLAWFQQAYAAHPALIASAPDHSLFPLVKLPVIVLFRTHPTHPVQFFLKVYMVFAGVAGVALWAGVIRKQPMLNQILALAICAVLLPPVSYDYTLAHLFVPFGLLCLYACDLWRSGQEPPSSLRGCFILFAFIFTDMMYMTFKLQLAGQFRAIALLLLLIAVLRLPMPWAWLGDGNGLSADHGAVVSA